MSKKRTLDLGSNNTHDAVTAAMYSERHGCRSLSHDGSKTIHMRIGVHFLYATESRQKKSTEKFFRFGCIRTNAFKQPVPDAVATEPLNKLLDLTSFLSRYLFLFGSEILSLVAVIPWTNTFSRSATATISITIC